MHYVYTNHLGSYNVITDAAGNVEEQLSFDACLPVRNEMKAGGRRRNATDWSYTNVPTTFLFDRGYIGQEHLDIFGLINLNGRIYEPLTGRFLSADNFVQAPDYSQSFNRYAYCLNNPLAFTDPDGNNPVIIAAIIIGAYMGGASTNDGNFNPFQWDWNNGRTYGGIVVGGVAGWAGASAAASIGASAIAGGTSAIEAGIGSGAIGGMISGGINGAGITALNGGNYDDVFGGMVSGAVMGGFSGAAAGGVNAAFGDFRGVAGGGLKNALYEVGFSSIKGGASGLAAGGVMAAMNRDASYLWKGAAYGAAFGAGMAGMRIATMGPTFIPDPEIYCDLEDYGQVYRSGSIFTPRGAGITLGRNVVVKLTGNTDYDRYLLHHETGHIIDINKMGAYGFYRRTLSEYRQYSLKYVYDTPGTLEWSAESHAFQRLGYIYNSFGKIQYTW